MRNSTRHTFGVSPTIHSEAAAMMLAPEGGFPWSAYWEIVLGILISVVLPILRSKLPKPPTERRVEGTPKWQKILAVGLFSILTAVIILAMSKDKTDWTWQEAVIAGFAWDSFLQKLAIA
jgi:hypothetical protein